MGNLHAVAISGASVAAATETVIATMTAFVEREGGVAGPDLNQTGGSGLGSQGIYLGGSINYLPGTGTTAVIVRVHQGTVTGPIVGVAQTVPAVAGTVMTLDIGELDPTLVQVPAVYVVSLQQTGGTAVGTVNRVVFTAEEASAFA